jgi:hypothetical protein
MVTSNDATAPSDSTTGIDLRELPAGTEVAVDTQNSRYRLIKLNGDGWNALVQGGRNFRVATVARVEGSTRGGSRLKIGWIGLGQLLEFSVGGKRIITSRVRAISLRPR